MKITFTLLFLFTLTFYTTAQDCQATTSTVKMDANNCKVTLPNGGDLFWDRSNSGYVFPNTGGPVEVHAIFAGGFWLSGFDPSGNLKVTAQSYNSSAGNTAFFAGPTTNNDLSDLEICILWDRHFMVEDSDIMNFRIDFGDGVIDDPIPFGIKYWPAKDNPFFFDAYEFELPEGMALAPFWDENQDGTYNPNDGDYPLTKGADQAVWWIMNDVKGVSRFDPVGVTMSVLALSYADANPALNNSTIYEVKIENITTQNLNLATISLWLDPELGCFTDDYVGCMKEEDLGFIYNMDEEDGDVGCTCPQGVNTYCGSIPVMGIKLLKGPLDNDGNEIGLSSFLTFNNGSFSADPNQAEPQTAIDHANYMQGFWRDGAPMMEAGEIVSHQYSGNPADAEAYTMCSTNATSPDKRMLMNFGTFNLPPAGVQEMSFAITGLYPVEHPCPDMSGLVSLTNELKEIYNNGIVSEVPVINDSQKEHSLKVYPNPMNNTAAFKLETDDSAIPIPLSSRELIEKISINAMNGKQLLNFDDIDSEEFNFENMDLPAGVYIYKAHISSNKVYTGKLVVIRF